MEGSYYIFLYEQCLKLWSDMLNSSLITKMWFFLVSQFFHETPIHFSRNIVWETLPEIMLPFWDFQQTFFPNYVAQTHYRPVCSKHLLATFVLVLKYPYFHSYYHCDPHTHTHTHCLIMWRIMKNLGRPWSAPEYLVQQGDFLVVSSFSDIFTPTL